MRSMNIFYHYYPSSEESLFNLASFMKTASVDLDNDYFINLVEIPEQELPKLDHLHYFSTKNIDADYGGLCHYIHNFHDEKDDLIVVNSSVAGPFYDVEQNKSWTSLFTDLLIGNIGLVGSTVSYLHPTSPHAIHYAHEYGKQGYLPHVQTFAYLISSRAIGILKRAGFFDASYDNDRDQIVSGYELNLSQMVMGFGMEITSIANPSQVIALGYEQHDANESSVNGDVMFKDAFYGRTLHPYETVFVITRRQYIPDDILISLLNTDAKKEIELNIYQIYYDDVSSKNE